MAKITRRARMAAAQSRARATARDAMRKQQHTIIALGTAGILGWMERQKFRLPTVVDIYPPALYGSLALLGAWFIRDAQFRRIAESMADGLLSVSAHRVGRMGAAGLFAAVPAVTGYGEEIIETGEF